MILIFATTVAKIFILFLVLCLYELINNLCILIPEKISLVKNKKLNFLKLENLEFEDTFNIYSEDYLTARSILTPSFMYRIYDYVNKINKNRKYDFYFKDDYIYINHKVNNNYLDVSFFKSLYVNISDYVEFYQELKNISQLASDLKLSFYDKNF
jgi:hypothetical protein